MSLPDTQAAVDLPQGDVNLLDTPTAQHLLTDCVVARLGYTGKDGHRG